MTDLRELTEKLGEALQAQSNAAGEVARHEGLIDKWRDELTESRQQLSDADAEVYRIKREMHEATADDAPTADLSAPHSQLTQQDREHYSGGEGDGPLEASSSLVAEETEQPEPSEATTQREAGQTDPFSEDGETDSPAEPLHGSSTPGGLGRGSCFQPATDEQKATFVEPESPADKKPEEVG